MMHPMLRGGREAPNLYLFHLHIQQPACHSIITTHNPRGAYLTPFIIRQELKGDIEQVEEVQLVTSLALSPE